VLQTLNSQVWMESETQVFQNCVPFVLGVDSHQFICGGRRMITVLNEWSSLHQPLYQHEYHFNFIHFVGASHL
jgi:hypothetical protein